MAVVEPRKRGSGSFSDGRGRRSWCRAGSALGECQEGWSRHLLRVKQGMQAVLDW